MLNRKAARARCDAATSGPWLRPWDDGALTADGETSLLGLDHDGLAVVERVVDAKFIEHAVEDLPAALDLLDKIEALAAEWETIASEDVASYTAQAHYVGRSRELRAILEPA
jgi:hypothetical protein